MLLRLILTHLVLISYSKLSRSTPISTHLITLSTSVKNKTNSFTSQVVCDKNLLITSVTFKEAFHGVVYAKGYPKDDCIVYGNGSKVIHISTNIHDCGVKIDKKKNESLNFEVFLQVQYEPVIHQAGDERIRVNCSPREILLIGAMGKQANLDDEKKKKLWSQTQPQTQTKPLPKLSVRNLFTDSSIKVQHWNKNPNFTLADIAESVECRMDVMKGRLPYLKPVDGFVDIGQDITILIKVKEIAGISSMLSKCYAHDGSHIVTQELTNEDGCTIDKSIMPNFYQIYSNATETKIYYNTFPAFKFPDRSNLHIQCTIIICNITCPQPHCDGMNERRLKRDDSLQSRDQSQNTVLVINLDDTDDDEELQDQPTSDQLLSQIKVSNQISFRSKVNNIYDDELKNKIAYTNLYSL